MSQPIIGVTADSQPSGGYSVYEWYALKKNYCQAIATHGGIPFILPHHPELAEAYAAKLDGLLITGGDFDVDPAIYQAPSVHPTVKINHTRTHFEITILKELSKKHVPILGICGGHQLMNVYRGGSLYQHLPEEIPSDILHQQPNPRHEPSHPVHVVAGTLLHKLVGCDQFAVNSGHHQGIKTLGRGLVVNCNAEDGLIEGFEDPSLPFFMGVQWHPEFFISECDHSIIRQFVSACKESLRP